MTLVQQKNVFEVEQKVQAIHGAQILCVNKVTIELWWIKIADSYTEKKRRKDKKKKRNGADETVCSFSGNLGHVI